MITEKNSKLQNKIAEKLNQKPLIFTNFYRYLCDEQKSFSTIDVYLNSLLHFYRFICKDTDSPYFYKDVSSVDIQNYLVALRTNKSGDDILQARYSVLNTFFSWVHKQGYINENPVNNVKRPKNTTEHKVTYLTSAEIAKLFKAIESNENLLFRMRDKTIISLAFATALRGSVLVNINIEDIDFENRVIKVVEKKQKVREIPIGKNMLILLRKFIAFRESVCAESDTSALFLTKNNNRLSVWDVNDMLEKYCDKARIKRITLSDLMETAICMLIEKHIPIHMIMGNYGFDSNERLIAYVEKVFNNYVDKPQDVLDKILTDETGEKRKLFIPITTDDKEILVEEEEMSFEDDFEFLEDDEY